jgi:hypothetical protein
MSWSTTKEMTEALKNIATLIFYVAVTAFFAFSVWPRIKDYEPQKWTVGGIEFGPKEKAALKAVDAVSNTVSKQAKDTTKIPFKLVEAAKIIDTTINQNNKNWVYLGQKINNKLTNTHFKIKDIPQPGDAITALDAVYKRKDLPIELANGNWKLGDIRGVVADNESVEVIKIQVIQDQNYWALVQ